MRTNWLRASMVTSALLIALQGIASAHVGVYPNQVAANASEIFTLRVPNEKEIPTVKVKVEVPTGFTVSRVQPLPGWNYEFTKDAAGAITAITWSGGEIKNGEFMQFIFQGKAPKDAGKFSWKSYQTYQDGSVAEWTGASDSKSPASTMTVTPAAATGDSHGATTPPATTPKVEETKPAEPVKTESKASDWAGWGGLALGAVAVLLALFKKK
jgi:uncharacterized protein YcnI